MGRKILYLVPLVLPFVLYGLYAWWARRQARQSGASGAAVWDEAPWVRLASAGIVLFIIALVVAALLGGDSVEGTYVPPHMVDGKIVPGEVR